jgi:CDK-activating kinase assembly factor MAT1
MSRRSGVLNNESDPSADICPVCKSNRYLNPNLTFLINPECYHTMCTSCVDRLFTSGPAPCPVAGCHKTLRKKNFHPPFFADLAVEREVDVRKRVGAIYNRAQDDFETLLDWNNYLEEVESLIFDIVNGTDSEKRAAEERLKAYADEYKDEIKESARAQKHEVERQKQYQAAEADGARRRRIAAAKEDEEEKADAARTRRQALDALASGEGDANVITAQANRRLQEQAERRKGDMAGTGQGQGLHTSGTGHPTSGDPAAKDKLALRGLKKKAAPVEEKPYDPFGGVHLKPTRYVLQDHYENVFLERAAGDPRHMVGGYSFQEYYARTMFEAFSGLEVFIEDEVSGRPEAATAGVVLPKAAYDVF